MEQTIIGVDTGGTFTDLAILDAAGRLTVRKLPSTPADPSQSVLQGIVAAHADGLASEAQIVSHGTTVATNALLERRGARSALIVTAGFRDMLEIGRQTRAQLYSLHPARPAPLLAREDCFELRERVDWQGNSLESLNIGEAETLLEDLKARGFESLAVCFLFSYLNPAHERLVGRLARERGFAVSLSSDIAPEPREAERAATTAANAFVAPRMAAYLGNLQARLTDMGLPHLRVMQSNGGALSAGEASLRPIATALSGPAGGVAAAAQIGLGAGFPDLLTFDMGGTSTDVALILGGQCPLVTEGALGGIPLRMDMLAIHTVGAGGGSLARVDGAGSLRVGPQSAGADPGPVAYGRGDALTVTDAHVLLGRLPADTLLAGHLPLDLPRVRAHFDALSGVLGISPEQAALGILAIADAAMTRALRHVSAERGHDPARLTLLSFGGAGGLHACSLARALGTRTILVPRYPGAFSALGLALADIRREYPRAVPPARVSEQAARDPQSPLARLLTLDLQALRAQADADMRREGFAPAGWRALITLDMRYAGQSFALRVPLETRAEMDAMLAQAVEAFHDLHAQRFGYADRGEPVEVTALRFAATGSLRPEQNGIPTSEARSGSVAIASEDADAPTRACEEAPTAQIRPARWEDGWQDTRVFYRADLTPGQRFDGPALLLQEDATTCVAPGWRARVDAEQNLLLERREK